MIEYDVTPREQGSNCFWRDNCLFYKYQIYCNECTQFEDIDDLIDDDYEE